MAALLSDLGQLAPAAAALEQVIASGRDSFPSVRHTQLSGVYSGLGRGADALAAAERAVALCGESKVVCIEALQRAFRCPGRWSAIATPRSAICR